MNAYLGGEPYKAPKIKPLTEALKNWRPTHEMVQEYESNPDVIPSMCSVLIKYGEKDGSKSLVK